ncbi:formylglycine-generating enzyme family protein [Pseudomonas aeruginosa]|uniref:formylglycine-generating enzyme family protein n=1 Tax=Pseudomonas aeruginosa TaxID=287 RepID=UPI003DA6E10D
MYRLLLPVTGLLAIGACHAAPASSQSLSAAQVTAIAQRIEQRYAQQPASERQALLKQVVTAIDNMVFVQGGTFEMGDFGWASEYDPAHMCEWPCGLERDQLMPLVPEADARPLHTVRLDSYYLAKYHTTIGEDDRYRLMNGKPLYRSELTEEERALGLTIPYRISEARQFKPDFPARSQWQDGKDYCLWLGEMSGLPVDLPTEAQHEYAARSGGRYVVYPTDTGSLDPGRNVHGGADAPSSLKAVGHYPPNPLGLYEMGENARSWVNDWYDPNYYQHSPVDNPQGPDTGTEKVMRGGLYYEDPQLAAMTTFRFHEKPVLKDYYAGVSYRCAIQQSGPLKK